MTFKSCLSVTFYFINNVIGTRAPYVIMDQGGIRLVLNYAANQPKQDIYTTVIWIASSRQDPIADVSFTAKFASELSSKVTNLLNFTSLP